MFSFGAGGGMVAYSVSALPAPESRLSSTYRPKIAPVIRKTFPETWLYDFVNGTE